MKCINCGIEVSVDFVKAIFSNDCPACGKQLMDNGDYKKIFALKKNLAGLNLGLSEQALVKVSAAINSKFELWPRDTQAPMPEANSESAVKPAAPVNETANFHQQKQQLVNKLNQAINNMEKEGFDDDDDDLIEEEADLDSDLTEAERAELIREFGLANDKSQATGGAVSKAEMQNLRQMISETEFVPEEFAAEAERMARARTLQAQVRSGMTHASGMKPITRIG